MVIFKKIKQAFKDIEELKNQIKECVLKEKKHKSQIETLISENLKNKEEIEELKNQIKDLETTINDDNVLSPQQIFKEYLFGDGKNGQ